MIKDQEIILQEELKDRLKHRDVVIDLQTVLGTKAGKNVVKYLLESFDVGKLPEQGLPSEVLHEYLGFLRAGRSVFEIVSEANFEIAGNLLAQIEKERYETLLHNSR